MNKIKAKREVYNAFKPYMQKMKIFRIGTNDYGEKQEDLYVCTIEGYYRLAESTLVVNYRDSGAINKNYNEKLSVMVTEDSLKIKQNDYFILNDTKYRIINIQNILDVYLDFTLERV